MFDLHLCVSRERLRLLLYDVTTAEASRQKLRSGELHSCCGVLMRALTTTQVCPHRLVF